MTTPTTEHLSLRQDGDGADGGPLLAVDGHGLGAPAVARQPDEALGGAERDRRLHQALAVVLVHKQHHDARVRERVELAQNVLERVGLDLTRDLQRRRDAQTWQPEVDHMTHDDDMFVNRIVIKTALC